MSLLARLVRILLLSLLAGGSCTASEQSVKNAVSEGVVSVQALQAGIELADESQATGSDNTVLVRFYITNPTDRNLELLTWNTPLEQPLSADVFQVKRDDKAMEYLGRMVKRSAPDTDDFVVVPPGERMEALLDISRYYDMSIPGTYKVSYKPAQADGMTRLNQHTEVFMSDQVLTVTIGRP